MMQAVKRAIYSFVGAENFLTLQAMRQIRNGYEPAFRDFLKLIPHDGLLLDVGANIGISCAIAHKARPDLKLVAFEPLPQNLKVFRRIQKRQGFEADLIPVAIGDSEGDIELAIPTVNGVPATGLSHVISGEFHNPAVTQHPFSTVTVPITTLDSFIVRMVMQFSRVHAIKIDVEDHEFHVLNGARALLASQHPLVFCELWDTPNRPKSIALMDSFGYSVREMGAVDFLFSPN